MSKMNKFEIENRIHEIYNELTVLEIKKMNLELEMAKLNEALDCILDKRILLG